MYIKGYDSLGNSLFKAIVRKDNTIDIIIKNHTNRFVDIMVLYNLNGEQIKIVFDVNCGGVLK